MVRILLIFLVVFAYGDDIKDILKMIDILKQKSFKYQEISSIYNPFDKQQQSNKIIIKTTPKIENKVHKTYNVEIIFQNRVRINNSWYKNGDKIDNYTIIIKNNKVYLKNNSKTILLKRKTLLKVSQ